MAGTTVGVLRALLTADTAQFDAAMASASAKTQAWSTDFTKLGLTAQQVGEVFTNSLARSLTTVNNLAKEFSGAGIAKAADEYAAAVQRIGGVSQLTATEQSKVNALVTEAIAKYEALGQAAPAHLLALRDATKAAESSGHDWIGSLEHIAAAAGIAFSVDRVVEFVTSIVEMAGEIKHASDTMSVTAETAQRMKFAVEQNGGSFEALQRSAIFLNKTLGKNDAGTAAALEALGFELDKLRQMDSASRIYAIADAIAAIKDPILQAQIGAQLLGRNFAENLGAMKAGLEQAGHGAVVMSDETVKSLHEAEQSWKRLTNAAYVYGADVIGYIAKVMDSGRNMDEKLEATNLLVASGMEREAAWAKVHYLSKEALDQLTASLHTAAQATQEHTAVQGPHLTALELLHRTADKLDAQFQSLDATTRASIATDKARGISVQELAVAHNVEVQTIERVIEAQKKAATEHERSEAAIKKYDQALAEMNLLVDGSAMTSGDWAKALLAASASVEKVHQVTGISTAVLEQYKKSMEATTEATKKLDAANLKSAEDTGRLIDDTKARDLKASDETLAGKLADLQTWYDGETTKLMHSGVDYEHYYAQLDALRANYAARVKQAQADDATARSLALTKDLAERQKVFDALDAASEKSQAATLALEEKYDSLQLKMHGDTLQAQIRASEVAGDKQQAIVLQTLARQLDAIRANDKLNDIERGYESMRAVRDAAEQAVAIGQITQAEADQITKAFNLKALDTAFQEFARSVGGAFGPVVETIDAGLQSILRGGVGPLEQGILTLEADGQKSGQTIVTAWAQIGAAIGAAVVGIANFTKGQETATKSAIVMSDTQKGAQIGTEIMPGWGTLIGAGIGALIGAFTKPEYQKIQQDVGRQIGLHISEGVALGIAQVEQNVKKLDDSLSDTEARHYAVMLSLNSLLASSGGLLTSNTSANIDRMYQFEGAAKGLFAIIERGGELGAQAMTELGSLIGQFVTAAAKAGTAWGPALTSLISDTLKMAGGVQVIEQNWDAMLKAGTDATGLISKDLHDLIELNGQLGDKSAVIAKYVTDQATSGATSLGTAAKITADAYAQQAADAVTLKDLYEQLSKASVDGQADIQAKIAATNADLATQAGIIHATGLQSQDQADAMAAGIESGIQAAIASGQSFEHAVLSQKDAITALAKDMQQAGFTGDAAFDLIKRQVDLATDKIAGPALQALEANTAGVVALANAGALTATQFQALEQRIGSTAAALEAQGATSTDVGVAMQNDLQVAWELENRYGVKLDDVTQSLVDQAVQQGIVGEEHRSVSDQMLTATKRIADAAEAMAHVFGVVLPGDLDKFGKAGEDAAGRVKDGINKIPKTVDIDVNYNPGTFTPPPGVETSNGGYHPGVGSGANGTADTSAANEGFFYRPTRVLLGDAPGERGEYVLHASTVDALMAGPASAADAYLAAVNSIKRDLPAAPAMAVSAMPAAIGSAAALSALDVSTPLPVWSPAKREIGVALPVTVQAGQETLVRQWVRTVVSIGGFP